MSRAPAWFSNDYSAARGKFVVACKAARLQLESYRNPCSDSMDEDLCTDVAFIGPRNAAATLVITSGTHGVEGFCGSAIQTGLIMEGLANRLPPNANIAMVHAVNPYGFAHLRRVNEDNVDLNRNFIDHDAVSPENPAYDELADIIAPRQYWKLATGLTLAQLLVHRAIRGTAKLQVAITGGQYRHPEGLFYGGNGPVWSNATFRKILRRHAGNAAKAVLLDIHTGLGRNGHGEIILEESPGSPAHKRAVRWWGDRVKSTIAGNSVSAELSGTINDAFKETLPRCETTAATLEFGTLPAIQVLRAMQMENWLHHNARGRHFAGPRIKAAMRAAFYPDSDDWKEKVWRQGRQVAEDAIRGLAD